MELKAIAETVSKYAPLLGSVISESNPIAGLILMAIAKIFNVSSHPDYIINAINNDPDAALKLKKLEYEHEDIILQNQTEDRINARDRETKVIQLTGKRDWVLDFLSIIVVIGFFSLCILNYFIKPDDDNIIIMLIGQISSGFMLCLSYYFGSSNK
jgi:hypothetical protein